MPRVFSRTLSVAQSCLRRFRRDESGSVIAYMVAIPVLAGALAIGVETGELYRVKHQMQGAADDAALAAVVDMLANLGNPAAAKVTATTDALYEAQRNGFTNGSGTISVTVNIPPTQGPNVGTTNAVEVIVSKTQNLSFASVLNKASTGVKLTSRSVAIPGTLNTTTTTSTTTTQNVTTTQTTTTSLGCIVALTPNAEQGVSFTNFSSFTSDCMIMSNGTANGTGSNASINLSQFSSATLSQPNGVWTRGTYSATSYTNNGVTPAPSSALVNQTSSVVDPYAGLATPSPGTCTRTNYSTPGGNSVTVPKGNYCGGLTVSNNSTVYFQPGTYYITNGDFVISGVSTVSCPSCTGTDGTTFVLTQTTGAANIGGVSISNESTITLNAPTVTSANATYPYPGVLFYQDRSVAAGTMSSTAKIFSMGNLSSANLSGAIYFPQNAIKVSNLSSSGSSSTGCTVWIGRYIQFSQYSSNYVKGCTSATVPAGYTTTTTTTTPQTTTTTQNQNILSAKAKLAQ